MYDGPPQRQFSSSLKRVTPQEMQSLIPGQAQEHGDSSKECCKNCGTCCVGCLGLYLVVLVVLAIFSFFHPSTDGCAIIFTNVPEAPIDIPIIRGTRANIADARWPHDQVDLTGLWWIRWVGEENPAIAFYNWQRREILVTFADSWLESASSTGGDIFPAVLMQPAQQPHHWAYSDTIWSMANQMQSHSRNWDPDLPLKYSFDNSTYALIDGNIGPFIFKNQDEWIRENYGGELNYYLTRIADANGVPHPKWWNEFVGWMGNYQLAIWGSLDNCRKQCEVFMGIAQFPATIVCNVCASWCT